MTNEEYVRRLGALYNKVLSLKSDDDYIVNQPQMNKLIDAIKFFSDTAEVLDGELDPVFLTPREEHGGVTATFLVFDVAGDDCKQFAKVIENASAVSIDSLEDGRISISITIPQVFIKR